MRAGSNSGIFLEGGPIVTLGQADTLGIPNSLILLLIVAVIGAAVINGSPFGRNLLAVGGGQDAARLLGIQVSRLRLAGYMLSGFCAAIAGIVLAGRSAVAIPQAAAGSELLVFSAVLPGGTALGGGRASVLGSLLAVLLLNVLYAGLVLQHISPYWQTITQGLLLLVALWLLRRHEEGRHLFLWLRQRREARSGQPSNPT